MRIHRNITLYVHRLSCLFFLYSCLKAASLLRQSAQTLSSLLHATWSRLSAYQFTGCRVFSSARSDRQTPSWSTGACRQNTTRCIQHEIPLLLKFLYYF